MKTFFAAIICAAVVAPAAPAQDHQHQTPPHAHEAKGEHGHAESGEKMSAAEALKAGGGRIRRGEPLGAAPAVAFADVLKEPAKFAGRKVLVEGVVERVCQQQGCWVQIAPEAGSAESVRVTFDHKFFVPKDADKMKFRAEGAFAVKTLSKEEVEHLVKEDDAKIKTNADGTAHEVSFVATGVELWK